MARTRRTADCDMMASTAVLVLGVGVGIVRSWRAGSRRRPTGAGLVSGVKSGQDWQSGVQEQGASSNDGRPSAIGADGWGSVTLRARSGGAGEQLSTACAIRPGGGGRRRQGGTRALQAVAGFIPKVVKALRPVLHRCCKQTAAAMARWGMAGGGEEILSVRQKE
jgi:hypothetical protein